MKKYFVLPLILLFIVFIESCSDNSTNPPTVTEKGSILIDSDPQGAEIFRDGQDQNKTTPDSLTDIDPGTYQITLKLNGYRDTTISVDVTANIQTSKFVEMKSSLTTTLFGSPTPIRIYETFGTPASLPSGLQLSTGNAYGVSSADGNKVDLYYYTNSNFSVHEIRSPDSYTGLTKVTHFLLGGTNLMDGTSSSTYPNGGWNTTMSDASGGNYYFIYTDDNHYVKLKIVADGTDPNGYAYLDIEYIYNNTVNDIRF